MIKNKYKDILLVQIGSKNDIIINNIDICLNGKTTFLESLVLIKFSLFLADCESGLVHYNHCLHGKSLVLFGPTPIKYFSYSQNVNIKSSICNNCMWIDKDWLHNCINYSYPKCMASISPKEVFNISEKYNLFKIKKFILKNNYIISPDIHYNINISNYKCKILKEFHRKSSKHINCIKIIENIIINQYGHKKNICILESPYNLLIINMAKKFNITVYSEKFGTEEIKISEYFNFSYNNNFNAIYGSIYNIPSSNNIFDIIIFISKKIYNFQELFFSEIYRVLNDKGILITNLINIKDNILLDYKNIINYISVIQKYNKDNYHDNH